MANKKKEIESQGAIRLEMNKDASTAVKYLKEYLQENSIQTTSIHNYNITVFFWQQVFRFILMAGICVFIAALAFNKILEGGPLIGVIGTIVGYVFGQNTKNNQ